MATKKITYYNTISSDDSLDTIENLLGLVPESIQEVSWEVRVQVHGKDMPSTLYDPPEYAEIEWEMISTSVLDNDNVSRILSEEDARIIEGLMPQDEEIYWDMVTREY